MCTEAVRVSKWSGVSFCINGFDARRVPVESEGTCHKDRHDRFYIQAWCNMVKQGVSPQDLDPSRSYLLVPSFSEAPWPHVPFLVRVTKRGSQ